MTTDPQKMARAQVQMEQFAAEARELGAKVEVSEAELEALVGFAEVGADMAMVFHAIATGDKEMEIVMKRSVNDRLWLMGVAGMSEEEAAEGTKDRKRILALVAKAACGLFAIVDSRLSEYRLVVKPPEEGE